MSDIISIKDYIFEKSISENEISSIVKSLAEQIRLDYSSGKIVFLVVLKGAFIFAADLIREIGLPSEVFFINSSSYKNMLKSTGKVDIQIGSINIENKDVLILEDIVDSGQTLKALTNDLKKFKPNSIEIATFLSKPLERITDIQVKYVGIEIPSKFVVGYGLDYAEYGRYLKDIYSLKSNII